MFKDLQSDTNFAETLTHTTHLKRMESIFNAIYWISKYLFRCQFVVVVGLVRQRVLRMGYFCGMNELTVYGIILTFRCSVVD